MRWRVLIEVTGSDGCVSAATLATGECSGPTQTAATLGLTLTEGKTVVAALQQVIVRAQTVEHCASQHMRWSPRGAHLMLKVRTAVMNDTFAKDHAAAEMLARRPYLRAA